MLFRHNEQPFLDDNSCQFAYKNLKEWDYRDQPASFPELFKFSGGIPEKQPIPGRETQCIIEFEDEFQQRKRPFTNADDGPYEAKRARLDDENCLVLHPFSSISELANSENGGSGSVSLYPAESTMEEKRQCLSFFPDYVGGFEDPEVRRPPVHEYPHRKPIPVGPDHQAELPMWSPRDTCLGKSSLDGDNSTLSVGTSNIECECGDEGSIRCARQHVMEAREELKKSVGIYRFGELGFFHMGEDVAQKWTTEEQQMFEEVVASNPASLGRNFWDVLPRAFPSRSSRELVSYYFNVFILRKRAEQNRLDPLHADSDDDEWEAGEEDSVLIESPYDDQDQEDGGADFNDQDCDDEELCDGWIGEILQFSPDADHLGKCLSDDSEGRNVEDDSCTSYDRSVGFGHEGLRAINCHEYIMGDYDQETWTAGYGRGTEKGVDFLPTSNVIEEVFGKETI